MTRIKLCGLSRLCDMEMANLLLPEYIGFVFAKKSGRYVFPDRAAELREMLAPEITAVGVFVRENVEKVAELLNGGVIDMAQLHGGEGETYLESLRKLTPKPIIQAFRMDTQEDVKAAMKSTADYVLLDSGEGGTGTAFDWKLLEYFKQENMQRPFFLAGGLNAANIAEVVKIVSPYAVDVSSGIETLGRKDPQKMKEFVRAVRAGKEERV